MKPTALITGASRGIGAALAETFAHAGYQLALCCRCSADQLHRLKDQLQQKYHTSVLVFIGDIGEYAFVKDMVNQTLAAFGSIDVLINNAGISYIGLLTDMSIEDWNKIVYLNLPYNQNHLTFDFSAINFSNPDAVKYQWKLEGFDNEWSPVSKNHSISYPNLSSGE